MHRFTRRGVDTLENQARQILNMPQAAPSLAGPTGQVSRIDEQLRFAQQASDAGNQLRYDQVKSIQP